MTINHKGASIFYTDTGSGTPIILLHGFLENHTMWDAIQSKLASRHRVICIDLLGHGASGNTGYVHTMEDMAAAVQTVVDTLAITKMHLVGHSMGGYVGLAFAKAQPERITSLCLLNSTPLPDDDERVALRTRANKMAKTQYEQLVRMSFTNLFDPKTKANHHDQISVALDHALKTPVQGYIAANSGMQVREDLSTFWKKAPFAQGMILGATDWIINAETHKDHFEKDIAFFKIIDSGHMSHISHTELVAKLLEEFVTASAGLD